LVTVQLESEHRRGYIVKLYVHGESTPHSRHLLFSGGGRVLEIAEAMRNATAVITGASSGIGRATALVLARAGVRVALAARNKARLDAVRSEIEDAGGEALVVPTDVSSQEQVEQLVSAVIACWGRVDLLVCCAGEYVRHRVVDVPLSDVERSMAVNFYGSVYAIREVLPGMLERRHGHIILVTSMDARKGLPLDAPYVAAKAALTEYAGVLRQECRGTGVEVFTVLPGRVDTPMISNIDVPWISAKIPPEKVATAILKAIRGRKAEVILPHQAKLLAYVNTFSPRLGDWFVRKLRLEGWEAQERHGDREEK